MNGMVVVVWDTGRTWHRKEFPNHKAARNFAAALRASGVKVTVGVEAVPGTVYECDRE